MLVHTGKEKYDIVSKQSKAHFVICKYSILPFRSHCSTRPEVGEGEGVWTQSIFTLESVSLRIIWCLDPVFPQRQCTLGDSGDRMAPDASSPTALQDCCAHPVPQSFKGKCCLSPSWGPGAHFPSCSHKASLRGSHLQLKATSGVS